MCDNSDGETPGKHVYLIKLKKGWGVHFIPFSKLFSFCGVQVDIICVKMTFNHQVHWVCNC